MQRQERIKVFGRVGKRPELRYTTSRKAVCNFTVAERVEGSDEPKWHEVVAWERVGECCSTCLKKGDPIAIMGRIKPREFRGKDGELRQINELHVDFLGISIV
ncbi:MAG: hypothetical protein COV38_16370 [Bdellovibrionales bacterium CG11_big_fil_rev_8_21_14_0_20_38_13]|nr:MAG: hypothetical protein COW79_09055 [Bdellovibrionales bacterium CG22_combo_CG10-13_8_21_14_all_38_13]PIR28334.1 MAG: hypothetical protein COV38_16370 [Bdellovibrionales bacterium CG11_big_fil_rev_8_21_14_0_20_38_13]